MRGEIEHRFGFRSYHGELRAASLLSRRDQHRYGKALYRLLRSRSSSKGWTASTTGSDRLSESAPWQPVWIANT
jgi:hypothetical protein